MTISISKETEALLQRRADREGVSVDSIADTVLSEVLREQETDREATLEGLRRGLADVEAGRVRPFAEFAEEMREKYNLPVHLSDAELLAEP